MQNFFSGSTFWPFFVGSISFLDLDQNEQTFEFCDIFSVNCIFDFDSQSSAHPRLSQKCQKPKLSKFGASSMEFFLFYWRAIKMAMCISWVSCSIYTFPNCWFNAYIHKILEYFHHEALHVSLVQHCSVLFMLCYGMFCIKQIVNLTSEIYTSIVFFRTFNQCDFWKNPPKKLLPLSSSWFLSKTKWSKLSFFYKIIMMNFNSMKLDSMVLYIVWYSTFH